MFADSKFIMDDAGHAYTLANLRRAALHALADRCDNLTIVCRLRRGDLSEVPVEDRIYHQNIQFLGVPWFRGFVGSFFARSVIRSQSLRAIGDADFCVMRYGSNISCIAQPLAKRMGRPCMGHALGEFDLEVRSNRKHIPIPGLRNLVAGLQLRKNQSSFQSCDMQCGVTESLALKYAAPGQNVTQMANSFLPSECYFPPRPPGDGPLRAVWAGRVLEFKNPHVILYAAARLKKEGIEIKPIIVGDGPFLGRLKAIAKEQGLDGVAEFPGRIESRAKLWESYRNADIGFMLSSSEGLPLAATELMSAGLPLLAADLEYMKPIMDDGVEGVLVDPNDLDAVTEKLKMLATDPKRRYTMAEAAYKRAHEWSAERQALKLIDLATRVIESKKK